MIEKALTEDIINTKVDSAEAIRRANKLYYRVVKRIFDIFVSIFGLLFLLPITLIIKIAYMCTGDFNKIIFTQKRIGKDGKEFNFYKFRSMIPNADEELKKLLKSNKKLAEEYKENKKLKNDPRITKIGKFIRKTSIDELPQLLNVLLGNMTMIGNRPYLPREKEDMRMYYNSIIATKPGITGYWQVSGRNNVTFQTRLQLEKYYSENCGLNMDIKIFFKTFKVVLFRHGAE